MNIMFCGDINAERGILFCISAICRYEKSPINFYILTANIENKIEGIKSDSCDTLNLCAKKGNPANKAVLLDISNMFSSYLPTANMSTRFTPACMLRLFADLIPEMPDKVLYLDTDVLCRKSFKQFYDTDISNVEIAGVPDRYGKWFFGNVLLHNYLNSGVLLLNMKMIKKNGTFEKCRKCAAIKRCLCRIKARLISSPKKERLRGVIMSRRE